MDSETGPGSSGDAEGDQEASPRFQHREQAMRDALRALLRDQSLARFGSHAYSGRELSFRLQFSTFPQENWQLRFDPPLGEQIEVQLADAAAEHGSFIKGRVYCFRCASSECEHSLPPDSLSVFRGFTATGVPAWCELVQALVDGGDVRADLLYEQPPAVLAVVQLGRSLKKQQLPFFGRASKTYSVLGQVVAGYFAVGRHPGLAGDRLAVTIQVVETRGSAGRPCLRINPVLGDLSVEEWEALLVEDRWTFLARGIEEARRRVEEMERQVQGAWERGGASEMRKGFRGLPHVLGKLARTVEQGVRQKRRRTRHAEAQRQRQRPVHKALTEAQAAGPGDLYFDEKRHTWIACGKHGRTHVFNEEGRHVTSFLLAPGGAEFRVRTRRWRAMQEEEVRRFKAVLSGERAGGESEVNTSEDPSA